MDKVTRFKAFLLMLLFTVPAFGAPLPPASQVLSSAIAAVNRMKALEASFTATYNGESVKGTITVAGGAFRLITPGVSTWFDGHTQWAYSRSADEVNISEPTFEELQQINPFAILRSVEKNYTPRRVKAPAGCSAVELTPGKKVRSPYAKVVLTVNDSSGLPEKIDVTSSDGVVTSIKINSIKSIKAPGAGAFRFPAKQYPGVEIIDLR